MSARDLLSQARADGVAIVMGAAGRLRYSGPEPMVMRWLAVIREHKDAIRVALSEDQDGVSAPAWLLHFTDRDPLEVHFFPAAVHAEALAAYPAAVAAEALHIPMQPSTNLEGA
jgi:hypothetical protein